MTVIQRLAAFTETMEPPAEAMEAARRALLDWLGAAIAGGVEPPATLVASAFEGPGPCQLFPIGSADPRTAALINGTASHTVEVDDIFRDGLFHPGVVTIPAALAAGEAEGIDGAHLMRAIIAGYEVSNRIARAVNPSHYQYWHTTGTVGFFGAAAGAAVALSLDASRTGHALATSATFAAGLRHAFSSDAMSKPLHAGRAAEGGVAAAMMARAGVTGVMDMLDGARGFGVAMSDGPDWEATLSDLGTRWTVAETTPKAHACCGHNFAALDAIAKLCTDHDLRADDIVSVDVRSYRAALDICGNPHPVSAAEARFSLPYCAGLMIRKGAVTPHGFSDAALAEPETRALASRVSLVLDDGAEARFPGARSATVAIRTTGGETLEHHRPTRKGDPDDPMTDAELAAKFRALASPVIGPDRAAAAEAAIATLESARDIRTLTLS